MQDSAAVGSLLQFQAPLGAFSQWLTVPTCVNNEHRPKLRTAALHILGSTIPPKAGLCTSRRAL
eukprot:13459175-Alexandrium_andersonii.AAC.1